MCFDLQCCEQPWDLLATPRNVLAGEVRYPIIDKRMAQFAAVPQLWCQVCLILRQQSIPPTAVDFSDSSRFLRLMKRSDFDAILV